MHHSLASNLHLYLQQQHAADKARALCRILYVRNLPFNITNDEMYEIFGRYGAIRQIRM